MPDTCEHLAPWSQGKWLCTYSQCSTKDDALFWQFPESRWGWCTIWWNETRTGNTLWNEKWRAGMTLDLNGILCSIMVLNPSVREGALVFLFARTKHILPAFSSHTKHSRSSHGRFSLATVWAVGNWQSGGQCRCYCWGRGTWKKQKERPGIWKKNNPDSKGSDDTYTWQRVISKTLGLPRNRTGGTNLQQPWTEIVDTAPLSRELSWPCACTHAPPQLQHWNQRGR